VRPAELSYIGAVHEAPIQPMADYRFCLPHNACFSNIFASPSGTLGEKCKLAHAEPCSMSGDLEQSGQPRGAQATVVPVWWRGMELTTLCRSELGGGEGESPTLAEHF